MRRLAPLPFLCLLLVGFLFGWPGGPSAALARMGGGEAFDSGGSSSSDWSSNDHEGGGASIEFSSLPWTGKLAIVGGAGSVLFLVVFTGVMDSRRARQSAEAHERMLALFQELDPDFDPKAIARRVERAFVRCQEAWFLRDLGPVRTLMSDSMFERLRTQLALMRAQGVRDALGEISVEDVTLVSVRGGTHFDRLTVIIDAHIEDGEAPATASDETALTLAQNAGSTHVREAWVFLRRRGANTPIGTDPFEGSCPNCGAPVAHAETTNCDHCDVIINSGAYDWTLCAIVQPRFMVVGAAEREPAGVESARRDDPEFSVEILEDRAALVFWLWIAAQSEGEPRRLAKFASPDFLKTLAQALERRREAGKRLLFRDCAIGAVRLERVWSEETHQKAAIVIEWNAGRVERGVGEGVERRPDERQRTEKTRLVLGRRKGTKTRRVEGLSTGRCPCCHAPVGSSLSARCDHCDTDLTTGDDWVLFAVDEPSRTPT